MYIALFIDLPNGIAAVSATYGSQKDIAVQSLSLLVLLSYCDREKKLSLAVTTTPETVILSCCERGERGSLDCVQTVHRTQSSIIQRLNIAAMLFSSMISLYQCIDQPR
jgi:hypothetical protein